jgi:hypothetical protein
MTKSNVKEICPFCSRKLNTNRAISREGGLGERYYLYKG